MISILLLSVASLVFNNLWFPTEANAQAQRTIHIAFKYEYFQQSGGATNSWTYTGSADLTPVDGGYDGVGTGQYNEHDVYPAAEPCSSPHVTTASGKAELTVQARYSIDNEDTGGPDTSMYNSSTSVIELIYFAEGIPWQESPSVQGDKCIASAHGTYDVYGDCHFYGIDFSVGGTYQKADEDGNANCSITITAFAEDLRIFGTASSTFGGIGKKGMSNSRVVVAEMEDDYMKPLSVSKPNFFSETLTSDNDAAQYEFRFAKEEGKLPRILVVSLLWYVGDPEFAVTNGPETAGRFIPVYQALCVDEESASPCEKWTRTPTGYEAEVNFEYGSADKLLQTQTIMDTEAWEGGNATMQMMRDSAYIYYNSYLAVEYLDTLGLSTQFNPVMIKTYHKKANCTGAYFDSPALYSKKLPNFGDLGTFLDKVEATGSGIYICEKDSPMLSRNAPMNREWHELGHYLHYDMYRPYDGVNKCVHCGYANPSSNDSIIEGFAEFVSLLVNEYYGISSGIYVWSGGTANLETDYKVWHDEEFAVAGILWDIHDPGVETNYGFYLNGTVVKTTNFSFNLMDEESMDAKTMLNKIDSSEPKTLVDLGRTFDMQSYQSKVPSIFINHGAFPDIVVRDWRYQYNSEEERGKGQTGSLSNPGRLVRNAPVPVIPGSTLVSDTDSVFNMTVKHDEPFGYYDYSYLTEVSAGEPVYFSMSPEYYPSVLTISPVSAEGKTFSAVAQIDSDDYWQYIRSSPPENGVFRQISGNPGDVTSLQYIQTAKDLLSRVSQEYRAGNYTGAEALATAAYIDNFEHIEPDLVAHNATDLKEATEQRMRVELIGLIREKAEPQVIDTKIAEINSMLDEAIVVVPEFPLAGIGIMIAAIGAVVIVDRLRLRIR